MQTPWYKRPAIIVLGIIIASSWGSSTYMAATEARTTPVAPIVVTQKTVQLPSAVSEGSVRIPTTVVEQPVRVVEEKVETKSAGFSNNNYYTNVDGESVHSPAYTDDNSVPDGASARCRDGTFSFSRNRRGTCSHHGGVAEWL